MTATRTTARPTPDKLPMWIDTPDSLQRIKPPELDESVDVSGDGATQVEKDVGELLVDKYDEITEH